ncbi:MAG: DegV family protein [Oscillospiraceae bacterium]|nr:DegV family protein [Oscillospiraceae bacterium]
MEGIFLNPEKIAFLVDSCAEMEPRHREGIPVYVVPLRITCADGSYNDGETIFPADIYRRLESGEIPKTSLPEPARVAETLKHIKADGYEKVIALPLSSGLSGTHNMIRVECGERRDLETVVFDTCLGAIPLGAMVLQLWEDIRNGMTWETLVNERVPHLLQNCHAFFSVDTLEYLQKGGRIGKITALAGTVLNIKPILTFAEDGQLVNVAKVRGRKQVQSKLIELVKEQVGDHKDFNLLVANGGADEEMEELKRDLMAAIPGCRHVWDSHIDATLSVYIGKGVLGACIQCLD